jgi:hypothetical protein
MAPFLVKICNMIIVINYKKIYIYFFIKIWVPFHFFPILRKICVRLLFQKSKNCVKNLSIFTIFRKISKNIFHKNLGTVSLFSDFEKNMCTSPISKIQKLRKKFIHFDSFSKK